MVFESATLDCQGQCPWMILGAYKLCNGKPDLPLMFASKTAPDQQSSGTLTFMTTNARTCLLLAFTSRREFACVLKARNVAAGLRTQNNLISSRVSCWLQAWLAKCLMSKWTNQDICLCLNVQRSCSESPLDDLFVSTWLSTRALAISTSLLLYSHRLFYQCKQGVGTPEWEPTWTHHDCLKWLRRSKHGSVNHTQVGSASRGGYQTEGISTVQSFDLRYNRRFWTNWGNWCR